MELKNRITSGPYTSKIGEIPVELSSYELLSLSSVSDTSVEELLYEILDILTFFQNWKQNILSSILRKESFQNVLNLCIEVLHNPIAVFDMYQNLLFHAGTLPFTSDKSELWDYVLEHHRSPEEDEIASEINQKLSSTKKPFYYVSQNKFRHIQRLLAPLAYGNSLFGMIACSDISTPFTRGEYCNICVIQGLLEQMLSSVEEFHFHSPTHTPWYVLQLLRGKTVNTDVLHYNFLRLGLSMDMSYFVWTFQKKIGDGNTLQALIPNLSYALESNLIFYYSNQLILIDTQLAHYQNTQLKGKLHNFLAQNQLKYGCSMIFDDITHLHTAFIQCQIALTIETNTDGMDFIHSYTTYLLNSIRHLNEIDGLLYPSMFSLSSIKKEYRSELLLCLEKYIETGQNVTATAALLHVHRHTVLYRLERLETLLHIKFSDMTSEEIGLLWLSCRLIEQKPSVSLPVI